MGSLNPERVGHEASSVGILIIFASNLFILGCLEVGIYSTPSAMKHLNQFQKNNSHQLLSQPLNLSLASVRKLCHEIARLGCIMGIAWMLEFHPPFPHSPRAWDRDLYYFLCILLVIYSFQDIRCTGNSTEYLSRAQSEEWKGWMQFMFLLYHYFKAVEVYNAIRVMICCYVWLTGFGNFSFFYTKQDYSFTRLIQMIWRLNFLATICCLTFSNPYILYYICPLHTLFFLLVYLTMRIHSSLNHTKWMRLKFLVLGLAIFWVWDAPSCGFSYVMGPWLSLQPNMGAPSGVQWEWYFRSSLDHWAIFFGMIFAYNYPVMAHWVGALEEEGNTIVRWFCASVMLILGVWWVCYVAYPLEKQDYNNVHPYTSIVPLLVYVFFRNFTPKLRSSYLHSLHNIGKSTLETYVMQHHLWMSSNARTLITLVPGYPLLNAVTVSLMFALFSQELYRLTMSLRGMLLPNKLTHCLGSLLTIFIAVIIATLLGQLCLSLNKDTEVHPTDWQSVLLVAELRQLHVLRLPLLLTLIVTVLSVIVLVFLDRNIVITQFPSSSSSSPSSSSPSASSNSLGISASATFRPITKRVIPVVMVIIWSFLSLCSVYIHNHPTSISNRHLADNLLKSKYQQPLIQRISSSSSPSISTSSSFRNRLTSTPFQHQLENTLELCNFDSQNGYWLESMPPPSLSSPTKAVSLLHQWGWRPSHKPCVVGHLDQLDARSMFSGQRIIVIGDSIARYTYYALCRALGDILDNAHNATKGKHADLQFQFQDGQIDFLWAPFAMNVTQKFEALVDTDVQPSVVLCGCGLWDSLWVRNPSQFKLDLDHFMGALRNYRSSSSALIGLSVLWIQPTVVVDNRLASDLKREFMTDRIIEQNYTFITPHHSFINQPFWDQNKLKKKKKWNQEEVEGPTTTKTNVLVDGVLNSRAISKHRELDCIDGVHYTDVVYDVMAQVSLNMIRNHKIILHGDLSSPIETTPKQCDSARPGHSLLLMLVAAVMVLLSDNFFGLSWISSLLFPRGSVQFRLSWEDSYGPLHRRLNQNSTMEATAPINDQI